MDRNERVIKSLESAVNIMRDACDESGRAISRGDDYDAIRRVLNAFTLGFANASSRIQSALSALEDAEKAERGGV